jgi:hypothetical protein
MSEIVNAIATEIDGIANAATSINAETGQDSTTTIAIANGTARAKAALAGTIVTATTFGNGAIAAGLNFAIAHCHLCGLTLTI